jgi:hypothetical protein
MRSRYRSARRIYVLHAFKKKSILDVMPLDEKILRFSNRWYKPALDFGISPSYMNWDQTSGYEL